MTAPSVESILVRIPFKSTDPQEKLLSWFFLDDIFSFFGRFFFTLNAHLKEHLNYICL